MKQPDQPELLTIGKSCGTGWDGTLTPKVIDYKLSGICLVTEHPHSFATDMRALRQQCIGSSIEQTSPVDPLEEQVPLVVDMSLRWVDMTLR